MAKQNALQKIELHEKICRIMQKLTHKKIHSIEERVKRLEKILKARGLGKKEIRQLFRGKFTPANYNKDLMEKRWKKAKEAYKEDNPIKSYFYPRSELNLSLIHI